MAKRIIFWVIFVGIIGGLLECKAAIIEIQKVIKGFVTGGGVGLFIAMMLNIFSGHKGKQSNPYQAPGRQGVDSSAHEKD